MLDKKSNIDILFRDGLKNLEVLPPAMVWDNIAPVLQAKRRGRAWMGIAASVAALSLLATTAWLSGILNERNNGISIASSVQSDDIPVNVTLPEQSAGAIVTQTIAGSPTDDLITSSPQFIAYQMGNLEQVILETETPMVISDNLLPASMNEDENNDENYLPEINILSGIYPDPWTLPDALSDTKTEKIDRWAIGAGFAPSAILKQNNTRSQELDNMIANEKLMVSYSGSFSVSYNINTRFAINAGLAYSNLAQRVTGVSTYTGFAPVVAAKGPGDIQIATSVGKIVSSNNDIYISDHTGSRITTLYGADVFDPVKSGLPFVGTDLMQSFRYLEVPLYLRYKLVDRKIDINMIGGVSYSFLVGNSVHTNSFSGEELYVGYTEGMSPFNLTSSMGMGFEYSTSGNLSFSLEPMVRYYISPIGTQIGSSIHPWAAGIFTGLRYKF